MFSYQNVLLQQKTTKKPPNKQKQTNKNEQTSQQTNKTKTKTKNKTKHTHTRFPIYFSKNILTDGKPSCHLPHSNNYRNNPFPLESYKIK